MSDEATFASLGLSAPLLATLDQLGYEAPTPIQARTIPALLAGRDLIGQAQRPPHSRCRCCSNSI
jgi:ATP-dependent RNA helicase DeaD